MNVFIGLGGNTGTTTADQIDILRQSATDLSAVGCNVLRASSLYVTEPVGGGGRQPAFVNAVLLVASPLPPARLLAMAKRLERRAGRRRGRRNGPRPLDIDLLDAGGRIIGLPSTKGRAPLVLPHPELHRRHFVLIPLRDIAPHWRHPVLDRSIDQLLAGLRTSTGAVRRIQDSCWLG